jgi:CTP synthase
MLISGKTPDGKFAEIAEISEHPWFVAVQFHPEFRSKPLAPHPLFADFVRASLERRQQRPREAESQTVKAAGR